MRVLRLWGTSLRNRGSEFFVHTSINSYEQETSPYGQTTHAASREWYFRSPPNHPIVVNLLAFNEEVLLNS